MQKYRISFLGVMCLSLVILVSIFMPACEEEKNNNGEQTPTPVPSPTITPTPGGSAELAGTWKGTEVNGTAGTWSFVFTGAAVTVTEPNATGIYTGNYFLDTTKNPKTIEIEITAHYNISFIGKTMMGIYQLTGTALTIALNPPGHPFAPTGFDPVAPSRVWQLTKQ